MLSHIPLFLSCNVWLGLFGTVIIYRWHCFGYDFSSLPRWHHCVNLHDLLRCSRLCYELCIRCRFLVFTRICFVVYRLIVKGIILLFKVLILLACQCLWWLSSHCYWTWERSLAIFFSNIWASFPSSLLIFNLFSFRSWAFIISLFSVNILRQRNIFMFLCYWLRQTRKSIWWTFSSCFGYFTLYNSHFFLIIRMKICILISCFCQTWQQILCVLYITWLILNRLELLFIWKISFISFSQYVCGLSNGHSKLRFGLVQITIRHWLFVCIQISRLSNDCLPFSDLINGPLFWFVSSVMSIIWISIQFSLNTWLSLLWAQLFLVRCLCFRSLTICFLRKLAILKVFITFFYQFVLCRFSVFCCTWIVLNINFVNLLTASGDYISISIILLVQWAP